jgi:hypothetical protein
VILIVAGAGDTHAGHIAQILKQRGYPALILSKADFGLSCTLALDPVAQCGVIVLADGTKIRSDDIGAVWYRRPGAVLVDPVITNDLDRSFVEREFTQSLDAFFSLAFRRVVSMPFAQKAAIKPVQLKVASEVGLRVPKTLLTSNPEEALSFVSDCKAGSVHKAMTAPAHRFLDTRAWDTEDIRRIKDLPLCPTLFQERIHGVGDIRATVIGSQIFAAYRACGPEIVDSRLNPALSYSCCELPSDVACATLRLMDKLGLAFGTIDLKVADNGEHVFLEVNPQGQFLYIEKLTELPISIALADFLIADGALPGRDGRQ